MSTVVASSLEGYFHREWKDIKEVFIPVDPKFDNLYNFCYCVRIFIQYLDIFDASNLSITIK